MKYRLEIELGIFELVKIINNILRETATNIAIIPSDSIISVWAKAMAQEDTSILENNDNRAGTWLSMTRAESGNRMVLGWRGQWTPDRWLTIEVPTHLFYDNEVEPHLVKIECALGEEPRGYSGPPRRPSDSRFFARVLGDLAERMEPVEQAPKSQKREEWLTERFFIIDEDGEKDLYPIPSLTRIDLEHEVKSRGFAELEMFGGRYRLEKVQ